METKFLKVAHHTVSLTLKVVPGWGEGGGREKKEKEKERERRDEQPISKHYTCPNNQRMGL